MKILLILDWALWSALFLALIYALAALLTDRTRSPKAGPGLGVFLIMLGLAFSGAAGASLYWFARKNSTPGLILMFLVLAWPLMPVLARPFILAFKEWSTRSKSLPGINSSPLKPSA